jgi:ABC toxin N-terminal region/Neuraminidase-like domain
VPAAGAYRLTITLDKQDAQVEVRFPHLPGGVLWSGTAAIDGEVLGDQPDEYIELKSGIPYRFTIELHSLGTGEARVQVQGENLPRGSLAQLTLYPLTSFDLATRALTLFSKSLALAQGLGLEERELRYLLTHASDFSNLDLSRLPVDRNEDTPAGAAALFAQFMRLAGYRRVKLALADRTSDLIDIFEVNEADDLDQTYAAVAKLTRREVAVVKDTARAIFPAQSLNNEQSLERLWAGLQLVERFRVPVASLVDWTRIVGPGLPEQHYAIARDVRDAVKASLAPEAWQRMAQPIFDGLRQHQRDALVAHVMHTQGFERAEQLYEYFLIDPGMEPVVQTSRIRLAIASVQLFIQRCLLSLEARVHPSAIINADQWAWMKRYRVWEANRKIFLFPENWLEPEFRDDKTHLFTELESALLEGDVSDDLVEDVFLRYLRKLDELARLDIVTMHLAQTDDWANNTLHVIGRTYGEPRKYFYRRYAHQMWTPWEPITTEIEGDHIVSVIWRNRLHLFWVTFLESANQPAGFSFDPNKEVNVPGVSKQVEARLHWSEYLNQEWTTHESGGFKPLEAHRVKVDQSVDTRSVFMHVSKEYDDEGERGVYIHLGAPFKQSFYLAGRNSAPEKAAASAHLDPPNNPYNANTAGSTQYRGAGELNVTLSSRITTTSGKKTGVPAPQKILQQGDNYTLVPCDNDIVIGTTIESFQNATKPAAVKAAVDSGLEEIRALMKPVFYQDRANTFFVEPNVTERTIDEWQEWVTPPPRPDAGFNDRKWWEDLVVVAEVPKWKKPDPGDPVFQLPFGDESLVRALVKQDWLINPRTGVDFGGELIGPTGRAGVQVQTKSVTADAAPAGTVNVHPGSGFGTQSVAVLVDATAYANSGLEVGAAGLNVIGGAGFNSALAGSFA